MILDRHVSLGNECLFINENVEISGLDEVRKSALQNSMRENGTVKSIRRAEITDDIKEAVLKQLNAEYMENSDAYIICISEEEIIIYSESERGAFFGALYLARRSMSGIGTGLIYNYPCVPIRMLKLYLPSEDNIEYFKKLIDLSAYYGYNKIMLEI
ncbi:MAG: hypothetical protein WCX81_06185, partial [Monoglobales bacterium]